MVLLVLAAPVATVFASATHEQMSRTVQHQALTRHSVEAVAIERSPSTLAEFNGPAAVKVQWQDGANQHVERVVTPAAVEPGDSLTIWLDEHGTVVAAPLTDLDAKVSAIGVGATLWITAAMFAALILAVVHYRFERSRAARWTRDLAFLVR